MARFNLAIFYIFYICTPVIRENKPDIIGIIRPGMNATTRIIRRRPYLSANEEKANLLPIGIIEKRTFEPSSGGIGIRLNIAKLILTITTTAKIEINGLPAPNVEISILISIPKIKATTILESGPASATSGSAIFLFRRL